MPFATLANLHVLSAISTSWEVMDDVPQPAESGWDTRRLTVAARTTSAITAAASFPVGEQIGSSNFWVVQATPRCLGGGIWAVDLTCHGLFASRPLKVRGGAAVDQQTGEMIDIPGHADVRAQVLEASPTVELEYIQTSGSPPTHLVGLSGSPDYEPGVRGTVWASLTDPLYHYPYEWVMMSCDYDKIPGANVFLIRELWQYIHELSP